MKLRCTLCVSLATFLSGAAVSVDTNEKTDALSALTAQEPLQNLETLPRRLGDNSPGDTEPTNVDSNNPEGNVKADETPDGANPPDKPPETVDASEGAQPPNNTTNPDGSVPPQPDQTQAPAGENPDGNKPCAAGKTCPECKNAAEAAMATTDGYTCTWKIDGDTGCQLVPKADAAADIMCSQENPENENKNKPANNNNSGDDFDYDDEGDSSFALGVGLLAVVLLGVAGLRFCLLKGRGSGNDSDNQTTVGDLGSIIGRSTISRGRSSYSKTETVPLASTTADDDEEWGWEDSSTGDGGDLEMTTKHDDEDLTMAFAMSQTKRPPPTPTAKSSPGIGRKTTPKSSPAISRPVRTSALPTQSSYPHTSPGAVPTMQITSLGKSSTTAAAKKRPQKKPEDDLFASMGLSAKPTFSSKPKPAAVTKPSSLSAVDIGGDANWDDDGDLDDLLND